MELGLLSEALGGTIYSVFAPVVRSFSVLRMLDFGKMKRKRKISLSMFKLLTVQRMILAELVKLMCAPVLLI